MKLVSSQIGSMSYTRRRNNDVFTQRWYSTTQGSEYIDDSANLQLIGTTKTTYSPERTISKLSAATMLNKL